MARFEQAATGITRTTEHDTITRAVWVPLLRSWVTGLACGALAWLGAWGLGYARDTWGISAFVGVGAFLATWMNLIYHTASDPMPPTATASAPSRLVMVNAKPNADPQDDRASRFAAFVEAAEFDPRMRRLRGLGFADPEICEYRDVLLRLDWAAWNTTDKRGGWSLTSPAAEILQAMA